MTKRLAALAFAFTLGTAMFGATPSNVHAQVYKCEDARGKTVYADAPCAPGGKPLRLQDPTKQGSANPTACTQLLDETRRLASEAERETARGKTVSAASAKRQRSLAAEYQRRCAGISKSSP